MAWIEIVTSDEHHPAVLQGRNVVVRAIKSRGGLGRRRLDIGSLPHLAGGVFIGEH